ncbi:type II toxin-antitoxin system VapC family toxin [Glycomyces xiaoerkulensis]|uniref:type II toxin-antitoxin system VapC family toxin n=1 Tax=Glycomyces xiaoerkulensis TaxID=2038139 RepID=UPI0013000C63|nr:type II toxin-antitoxin system VapC family toxin [Glycomyces xiaoerkulensis]
MIVLDNSALIDATIGYEERPGLDRELITQELHVPHLIDYEFRNALRGMLLGSKIIRSRAEGAIMIKETLALVRYPESVTGRRTWDLMDNFNPYDATYVALAEYLGCPLVTTDAKMERGARTVEVRLY